MNSPHIPNLLAATLVPLVLLGLTHRRLQNWQRYLWIAGVAAIIVVQSAWLVVLMLKNVAMLREWDFVGFWLNAHVAAAHHNFYDPAFAQTLAKGMHLSEQFRREILAVGFWYPTPSMLVFIPLALFADPRHAYVFWYFLQSAALIGAVAVMTRMFLRDAGWYGAAAVLALLLMLPATASTIIYGQTSFLVLLFTALVWRKRDTATSGAWLVLAVLVKPLVALLLIVFMFRRQYMAIVGAIIAASGVMLITLLSFGSNTTFAYVRSRPDIQVPAWVFSEQTNQSLLGLIVRLTHSAGTRPSIEATAIFIVLALVLALITAWALWSSNIAKDVALGLALTLALMLYPVSQSFYAILLIVPALSTWSRLGAHRRHWATYIIPALSYLLMGVVGLPVLLYFLAWLGFVFVALPRRSRSLIARSIERLTSDIARLSSTNQSSDSSARGLVTLALILILAVTAYDAIRPRNSFFAGAGTDFRAFYCSGAAADAHKNPYLLEPLRSCEHSVQPADGWSKDSVVPSPLPGYDIAFFGAIARFPYRVAKISWYLILVSSLFIATFCLSRLSRLPALLVLASLALSDGYLSMTYGQIPPLVVAGISLSAYALTIGRYRTAALAAAVTMVEPHLGAPACLALFCWSPRTRLPLAAAGAALTLLSLVQLGLEENIAYFMRILPGQAMAELPANDEFSLSHLLHIVGLSDHIALTLGLLSYVLASTLGIWLAGKAAQALRAPALIVTIAPALALFGGSYLHETQFAAALPAALLLTAATKEARFFTWLALSLLIFPWFTLSTQTHAIGLPIFGLAVITLVCLTFTASGAETSPFRRAVYCCSAAIGFACLILAFQHLPGPPAFASKNVIFSAEVLAPTVDASANWGAYIRTQAAFTVPSTRSEAEKLPAPLALILIGLTVLSLRSRAGSLQRNVGEIGLMRPLGAERGT